MGLDNNTKRFITHGDGKKIVEKLDSIKEAILGKNVDAIYGIKKSLSTTSTSWVRTDDGIGKVANATHDGSEVINNFDNIYPWSDIISVNYDVANDMIVSQYGDADFAFDGSNGEVMTYYPRHFQKRWQDGANEYIQISKSYFDGAIEIEPFLVGRYTTSSGTHSKSGVASLVNQTRATFRSQAMALGEGWCQLDWHYFVLENLYLVEYANADSQSVLGLGVSSTSAQVNTGQLDSLGMRSGCLANAGATSVIYRGVENPFGNLWQFLDGLNIKDNQAYICYDYKRYADDVFTEPYQVLGYVNANANGNPNKMGYDSNNQLIALPSAVGTSTYSDYYWQNSGNRIAFVGGAWSAGAGDGFFCFYLSGASSHAYADIGSRLLKFI